MKTFLFSIIAVAVFSFSFHPAADTGFVTEKFKVLGNCGMCKARIEQALKVEGVRYAVWDQETKIVTVKFNPKVVTLDELHQKCADVGHDTDKVRAKDEVYANLHSCCLYDRDML
mgnify:CR=1 FL=1